MMRFWDRLLGGMLSASVLGCVAVYAQAQIAAPLTPDAKAGQVRQQRSALLSGMTPVTDTMLRNPPPGDWLQWLRTYDEQGFSPLSQINKKTVGSLRTAWTWSLPPGTSETTPIVHDGVLFVYGNQDRIQALDALTGDLLWEYTRTLPPGVRAGNTIKRSFAIYGDKLYVATSDSHVIALDAKTGEAVWDREVADVKLRYQLSSGPLVVKGKVIQGVTGCSSTQAGGCYIVALDAGSGSELWRFNTIARPGEPGGNTWNGLPLERRMGGSVWTTGSYDPDLNLVYFGTGNTYNWQDLENGASPGKDQPGVTRDGLYLNSTLALNPDTGQLAWHYQHFPEDLWDLDYAFERHLINLPINGQQQRVLVTVGKMVIIDVVDRATGKWIYSKDLGLQNIVSSIDPVTGKKNIDPMAVPDLTGRRNNLQCPAGFGAKNWPSDAYNPTTRIMYLPLTEHCGESTPKTFGPNNPYAGSGQETRITRYFPKSDGNIGRLDAVNLETRKVIWSVRQRAPITSAVVATSGGVLFAGDSDRWFRAYDDLTGKVLWQMRLNDAVNSYPITYSVKGKQYVAVVAGFGGPRIANLNVLTPEIQSPRGAGAALWVFELP